MPVKRHTSRTLPYVQAQEEVLPDYQTVMAEHGPKGEDDSPTFELPDFETRPYEPWLPEVDTRVEQEAAEKAPQIAAETARDLAENHPPYEYQLDSDLDDELPGDYELSWTKPPTAEPIKVESERLPSPVPRQLEV